MPRLARLHRAADTTLTVAMIVVTLPFLIALSSILTIRTAYRTAFKPNRDQ